jgi:hypothetical protein
MRYTCLTKRYRYMDAVYMRTLIASGKAMQWREKKKKRGLMTTKMRELVTLASEKVMHDRRPRKCELVPKL